MLALACRLAFLKLARKLIPNNTHKLVFIKKIIKGERKKEKDLLMVKLFPGIK